MTTIFDRKILKQHRDSSASTIQSADFLFKESFMDVLDRVSFLSKEYENVLNLGSRVFDLKHPNFKNLISTDLSMKMLKTFEGARVQADEEFIPFQDNSFDLVVSVLNLHWVNDLLGTLIQIRRILKKDGVFVASFIGGRSLNEVRRVFVEIESKLGVDVNLHVSPMIATKSLLDLMGKAKFSDVVVDENLVKVEYENPQKILSDLQAMGESNCIGDDSIRYLRKDVLKAFTEEYRRLFSIEGSCECSFDIITCVGYKK